LHRGRSVSQALPFAREARELSVEAPRRGATRGSSARGIDCGEQGVQGDRPRFEVCARMAN
jgi:hypothetical protein